MIDKTLFRAYVMARDRQAVFAKARGNTFGISVGADGYALDYQKASKAARRIAARFNGIKVCPNCIATDGVHFTACRYYND